MGEFEQTIVNDDVFEDEDAPVTGWLDNLLDGRTIVAKLRLAILGSALVPFITAATLLGTFAYFGTSMSDHSDRVQAEVLVGQAGFHLVHASQSVREMQMGSPEKLNDLRLSLNSASEQLESSLALTADLYPQGQLTQLRNTAQDVEELRAAIDSQSPEEIVAGGDQTVAWLRDNADGLSYLFDQMQDHAKTLLDSMLANIWTAFIVCLVAAPIFFLLSFFGARSIINTVSTMISKITYSMMRLSEGDLQVAVPGRERQDEIGDMARALEVFRKSSVDLRDMTNARARDAEKQLAQEQQVREKMREMRSEKRVLMEDLAEDFEVTVGELITAVSAASDQLKTTSGEMVNLAAGSNEQASNARSEMDNSTTNVTAAAAATDEFAQSISEISNQASASASLARNASELVVNANTKMSDLSKAALEVGEIVEMIQTIAQRTNLLALNASIEAARGGEAGRGFAVVASEVKELAMQTSNATNSVTDKITTMLDYTKGSASDLGEIVESIGDLEQAAVMIASAVDEQSVAAGELARNIDTVANGSVVVNTQLGKLSAASDQTGEAASEVVTAAKSLAEHAETLRSKANGFVGDVRRSAQDMEANEAA